MTGARRMGVGALYMVRGIFFLCYSDLIKIVFYSFKIHLGGPV